MNELSWRDKALFVAYQASFFLLTGGAFTALFAHRIGASHAVLGLTGHLAVERFVAIAGEREAERRPWPESSLPDKLVEWTYAAAFGLLMIGSPAAVLGHSFGALFLIVGFICLLVTHLTIGLSGYRQVMSRPWPAVAPLNDDDDCSRPS